MLPTHTSCCTVTGAMFQAYGKTAWLYPLGSQVWPWDLPLTVKCERREVHHFWVEALGACCDLTHSVLSPQVLKSEHAYGPGRVVRMMTDSRAPSQLVISTAQGEINFFSPTDILELSPQPRQPPLPVAVTCASLSACVSPLVRMLSPQPGTSDLLNASLLLMAHIQPLVLEISPSKHSQFPPFFIFPLNQF